MEEFIKEASCGTTPICFRRLFCVISRICIRRKVSSDQQQSDQAYISAVYFDRASLNIVKAIQKSQDSRFASARFSDKLL